MEETRRNARRSTMEIVFFLWVGTEKEYRRNLASDTDERELGWWEINKEVVVMPLFNKPEDL